MSYRSYHHSIQQPAFVDHKRFTRIVPISGKNRDIIYQKIDRWLDIHYAGYQLIQTAQIKENNRFYCRKTFRTADGRIKVILFDSTDDALYERNNTSLMFQGGTKIRVWTRQTSIPTRIEYFT
ncbi:unnamed protein product [Adineta steineri]|uniref:Uncharacterized protein n=2 Tax=Adineta steineri TaxID=433720 RepID=A0A819IL97_9BILA|nr:unnamed protein product [Adineta steineri]CAF3918122.1 unnamed protein product [Adineta steineri]